MKITYKSSECQTMGGAEWVAPEPLTALPSAHNLHASSHTAVLLMGHCSVGQMKWESDRN
jgi:hypothetical protein